MIGRLPVFAAFGLGAAFTLLAYLAAGPSLGLFFGGFFAAACIAPVAAIGSPNFLNAVYGLLACTLGIGLVWLIAVAQTPDTLREWAAVCMVLTAYTAAIGGLAAMLARMRVPGTIAAAVATVFGLAGLTWPIWLATTLVRFDITFVSKGLNFWPPLVANGVLINETPWSERSIAYRLANLNQDIPYQMPASAWGCIMLYAALAAILWASPALIRKVRRKF